MTLPKLELLEQEMDRKDFLKSVGLGLMLLMGGGMIVNAISGMNKSTSQHTSTTQRTSSGYGASGYGR